MSDIVNGDALEYVLSLTYIGRFQMTQSTRLLYDLLARFDELPDDACVAIPTVKALCSCSTSTVWRLVKSKRLPAPLKLSPRMTRWRVGELRASLAALVGSGS